MQVNDKSVQPDVLSWVKFSDASWTHDSKGFFYNRYPMPKILLDYLFTLSSLADLGVKGEETLGDGSRSEQSEDSVNFESEKYPSYANSSPVTKVTKELITHEEIGKP